MKAFRFEIECDNKLNLVKLFKEAGCFNYGKNEGEFLRDLETIGRMVRLRPFAKEVIDDQN